MRRITAFTLSTLISGTAAAHGQSTAPRPIALPAPNATLDAEFTAVTSVRELPDGRVLVVDGSEKKLLVVDWTKKSATQVGRNGSGPGEYVQPSMLFALGTDSTLLPDVRNGRWLILTGATIATTVGPDAPVIRNGARNPVGADNHGRVLFTRSIAPGSNSPTEMPRRDSLLLIRTQRATGKADTLGLVRARPATINIQGPADKPTAVSVVMNPLATGEMSAVFPDGWIAVARLDPYRVDWVAPDGKWVRGPSLPFERVRLDEREQRAFLERQEARTGSPPRELGAYPDWPEVMPPFLAEPLLRAPDGRVWIRRPATSANLNPPYDVVDRRGALVGRVSPGRDVEIIGFGGAAVYAVATDDNGIQRLQRRPLPKL